MIPSFYYYRPPIFAAVTAATAQDDDKPKKKSRVSRSRLTRTAPAKPKQERKKRVQKFLPPITIEEPARIVIPPQPALEAYALSLVPLAPVEAEIKAVLDGCKGKFRGTAANSGHFHATLEGCEFEMTARVQVEDDAVSLYMNLPDLEPELVDA